MKRQNNVFHFVKADRQITAHFGHILKPQLLKEQIRGVPTLITLRFSLIGQGKCWLTAYLQRKTDFACLGVMGHILQVEFKWEFQKLRDPKSHTGTNV